MSRALCCASLVLMVFSAGCEPSATPVAPVATVQAEGSAPSPTSAPFDAAAPVASGEPDAASTAGQPGVKTLFVREMKVDCEGEGPMKCMQVRESEKGEWTLFYGTIEGFKYEPGFAYELRVTVQNTPKPPAGGSSLKYRLAEVVSKKPAAGK